VNGKKAQLETCADDRGVFRVGILSRESRCWADYSSAGHSAVSQALLDFSINLHDILNI
jgi:hypothetical protein